MTGAIIGRRCVGLDSLVGGCIGAAAGGRYDPAGATGPFSKLTDSRVPDALVCAWMNVLVVLTGSCGSESARRTTAKCKVPSDVESKQVRRRRADVEIRLRLRAATAQIPSFLTSSL